MPAQDPAVRSHLEIIFDVNDEGEVSISVGPAPAAWGGGRKRGMQRDPGKGPVKLKHAATSQGALDSCRALEESEEAGRLLPEASEGAAADPSSSRNSGPYKSQGDRPAARGYHIGILGKR